MSVLAIAGKDLKRYAVDRRAMVVNLILPLVLTFIMGLSFGGGLFGDSGGISAIPIALVADGLPQALQDRMANGLTESGFFTPTWTDSVTADALVRQGEVAAAAVLPPSFLQRFMAFEDVQVQVWKDPGSPIKAGIVEQVLSRSVQQYQAGEAAYRALWPRDMGLAGSDPVQQAIWQDLTDGSFSSFWQRLRKSGGDTSRVAMRESFLAGLDRHVALQEALAQTRIQLRVQDKTPVKVSETARDQNLFNYFLPSFSVFFLLFAVAASCRDLHREKDRGTLQRQLLSPAGGSQLLLGKWLSAAVQGCLQLGTLYLAGAVLFRVNMGPDVWSLPVLVILCSGAATSVFMLLALISPTEKIMDNLSTVVVLVSAMLGGNMIPVDSLPTSIHNIGQFFFNYWANLGFSNIMVRDVSLITEPKPVYILFAAMVLLLAVNLHLFKRKARAGGLT